MLGAALLSLRAGAANLTLGSAQATAGGPAITLPLVLTPGAVQSIVGVQFDITYNATALTLESISAGPTAIAASKTLSTNVLGLGNVRAIVTGVNQNVIATGTVVNLSFKATGSAAGTLAIPLSNVFLAGKNGESIPVSITGGSISVAGVGRFHSADTNKNRSMDLGEVLRMVQFYNVGGFHCEAGTEDGFAPGVGDQSCTHHDSDYTAQDWKINFSEIIRMVQFYNVGGYAENAAGEDGFVPQAP